MFGKDNPKLTTEPVVQITSANTADNLAILLWGNKNHIRKTMTAVRIGQVTVLLQQRTPADLEQ